MRHRLLAVVVLALGCGSGSGQVTGSGGSGGIAPDGGGQAGGSGGGTGGAGTGGTTEASPGSATLRLTLPAGTAYCDQSSTCQTIRHVAIRTAGGQTIGVTPGDCPTLCDTCQPQPCPGIPCLPTGTETHDEELVWDGSFYEGSTCGMNRQCVRRRFARPGRYVAVMCATPGQVETPDGGSSGSVACRKTGDQQCVEVPFTFPSATPVVGRLPGSAQVRCGSTSCANGQICVNPCCGGPAPPCHPAPDGGACPTGSYGCVVTPGGTPGCATPCTPPPPYCAPAAQLPGGCMLGKDGQAICVCA